MGHNFMKAVAFTISLGLAGSAGMGAYCEDWCQKGQLVPAGTGNLNMIV